MMLRFFSERWVNTQLLNFYIFSLVCSRGRNGIEYYLLEIVVFTKDGNDV